MTRCCMSTTWALPRGTGGVFLQTDYFPEQAPLFYEFTNTSPARLLVEPWPLLSTPWIITLDYIVENCTAYSMNYCVYRSEQKIPYCTQRTSRQCDVLSSSRVCQFHTILPSILPQPFIYPLPFSSGRVQGIDHPSLPRNTHLNVAIAN